MNRRSFLIAAPIAAAAAAFIGAAPAAAQVSINPNTAASMISALRAERRVAAVVANGQLNTLARNQAQAMARANVLSHSVAGSFAARIGTGYRAAAKNIAAGATSLDGVINQWLGSRVHANNMLNPAFTMIGMAAAYNATSRINYYALILAG